MKAGITVYLSKEISGKHLKQLPDSTWNYNVEEKDLSRQEISRVLISVSDKSGIKVYSKSLSEKGIEIISTGGTSRTNYNACLWYCPWSPPCWNNFNTFFW
jgi:hypothetical protein